MEFLVWFFIYLGFESILERTVMTMMVVVMMTMKMRMIIIIMMMCSYKAYRRKLAGCLFAMDCSVLDRRLVLEEIPFMGRQFVCVARLQYNYLRSMFACNVSYRYFNFSFYHVNKSITRYAFL
jgi:hypothetical protein